MNSLLIKRQSIRGWILKCVLVFVVLFYFGISVVTIEACAVAPCPPGVSVDGTAAGFDNTNKDKIPAAFDNTKKTPANSTQLDSGIKNPLGSTIVDIPSFIKTILGFVLIIGVPIIALAIIYAGFLFVTAQGNSEALKKAKTTLLYTLIGAALLLGSYVIANAIKGTVDDITSST